MRSFCLVLLLALSVCFSLPASAELRVAHIFQDHMVLQQKKPWRVWGWAPPGSSVKVAFAGKELAIKADPTGYWKAMFEGLPALTESRKLTVTAGSESVSLSDVLVGEVWLCAGQSNMARMLSSEARDYPQQYQAFMKEAEYPAIRFIRYLTDVSEMPLKEVDLVVQRDTRWQVLSNVTSKDSMSIPFFFAKEINKTLGVPVGLVEVAVAGTPQTAWMARETLDDVAKQIAGEPDFQTRWAESEGKLATAKETYHDWAGFKAAEAIWKVSPNGRWPGSNQLVPDFPSGLYNAMIYPLAPLALQGVLWHQGESGPAPNHRERMVAQIAQWRKLFGQDFHFLWGSMARNTTSAPPLGTTAMSLRANVNEEFLLAAQDWGSGNSSVLLNFLDLGNTATHWGRKDEAGRRMGRAALATVYGKTDVVFTGPELVEAKIEGASVQAKFRYVGSGLVYEPSVDGISGFLLEEKGAAPALRWAEVAIKGDTVILSHPDMHKPTNAYYGWHLNPHETLFNKEGYPAYSFRAVPRTNASKGDDGPPLVELIGAPLKTVLDVKHVRRNGYLFSVEQRGGSGRATVRIRVPKDWKAATVTGGLEKAGDGGLRSHEFEVEINGPPITVGNSAKPPDFSAVDRF